jgi:hypothetical protein
MRFSKVAEGLLAMTKKLASLSIGEGLGVRRKYVIPLRTIGALSPSKGEDYTNKKRA